MMKTLNIVLLGTLLASSFAANAAGVSRHSDHLQYRIYDEHVSKHQRRINQKKLAHQKRQNNHAEGVSNGHSQSASKSSAKGHSNNHSKQHSKQHSNQHSKKHAKQHSNNFSKGHSKRNANGYSKGYSKGYSRGHANYDDRRNDGHRDKRHAHRQNRWETVDSFRGRSGKLVTRQINVDERVQELSLQGTKRGMVVRRAHALMGNGRWVRIEGLEGHLRHGEQVKHRLRKPRHVQKVVLEIAPERYKRGYADLRIKSAG